MEPEGSLPHLQEPVTCHCPDPDRSFPYPASHFLKIHLNIILPSKPGSSKWALFHRFPHQNPLYTSLFSPKCYTPRPSNTSRFDHPINIEWGIQFINPLYPLNCLHRPTVCTEVLFAQTYCLHRPTFCTDLLFAQTYCLHIPTVLHRTTFPTDLLFAQTYCLHRRTVCTELLFAQNYCSHRPVCTELLFARILVQ
jgi:hypothetical protein